VWSGEDFVECQSPGHPPKKSGEKKPDTRATNAEKNTPEGAQDQLESIEKQQQKTRGSDTIDSIEKSWQRFKNALKGIKSSKDIEPD
jgi:hypothetical protein